MDSDDRFYGALQGDDAEPMHQKSQEMTAWWIAYTIAVTVFAALVAIVLVILCAASLVVLELTAAGKRGIRLMFGRSRGPESASAPVAGAAGSGSDPNQDSGRPRF